MKNLAGRAGSDKANKTSLKVQCRYALGLKSPTNDDVKKYILALVIKAKGNTSLLEDKVVEDAIASLEFLVSRAAYIKLEKWEYAPYLDIVKNAVVSAETKKDSNAILHARQAIYRQKDIANSKLFPFSKAQVENGLENVETEHEHIIKLHQFRKRINSANLSWAKKIEIANKQSPLPTDRQTKIRDQYRQRRERRFLKAMGKLPRNHDLSTFYSEPTGVENTKIRPKGVDKDQENGELLLRRLPEVPCEMERNLCELGENIDKTARDFNEKIDLEDLRLFQSKCSAYVDAHDTCIETLQLMGHELMEMSANSKHLTQVERAELRRYGRVLLDVIIPLTSAKTSYGMNYFLAKRSMTSLHDAIQMIRLYQEDESHDAIPPPVPTQADISHAVDAAKHVELIPADVMNPMTGEDPSEKMKEQNLRAYGHLLDDALAVLLAAEPSLPRKRSLGEIEAKDAPTPKSDGQKKMSGALRRHEFRADFPLGEASFRKPTGASNVRSIIPRELDNSEEQELDKLLADLLTSVLPNTEPTPISESTLWLGAEKTELLASNFLDERVGELSSGIAIHASANPVDSEGEWQVYRPGESEIVNGVHVMKENSSKNVAPPLYEQLSQQKHQRVHRGSSQVNVIEPTSKKVEKGVIARLRSIGKRFTRAGGAQVAAREIKREAKSGAPKALQSVNAVKKEISLQDVVESTKTIRSKRTAKQEKISLENVKSVFADNLKTYDKGTILRANDDAATAIQSYLRQFAPEGLDEQLLTITDLAGEWPTISSNNRLDLSRISDGQMFQLLDVASKLIDLIGAAAGQMPKEVSDLLKDISLQTKEAFPDDHEVAGNAVTSVLFLKFICPSLFDVTTSMSSFENPTDRFLGHKAVASFCIQFVQNVANGATPRTIRDKRVADAAPSAQDAYIAAAEKAAPLLKRIAEQALA